MTPVRTGRGMRPNFSRTRSIARFSLNLPAMTSIELSGW